jgi:hypothetical protein
MPDGRKTFWIAATLSSVAFAELLFFLQYPGPIYDAYGYYVLSQRIVEGGLYAVAFPSRTYAYPLFVALCAGFQKASPETARVLVFHVQLGLLLAAAAFAARVLGHLFRSDAARRSTYAAVALSPFLLARATETLSDLLSAVLSFTAVLLALKLDFPARTQSPPAAAGGSLFLAALAAIVRPAAMPVLAVVVGLWIFRQVLWRELRLAIVPLLLLVVALPFLPQAAVNRKAYGRAEPLVVEHLYREQVEMGSSRLKYATDVRKGVPPQIDYLNPLYRGEGTRAFALKRPFAYLATCALHLFAVLDQDTLFTYSRDRHPPYRWPLQAVQFLFVLAGGMGAVLALAGRSPVARDPRRFATLSFLAAAAASLAIYVPTAVESRFATAFELFWTPFAVTAFLAVRDWWRQKKWKMLAALGVGAFLWLALCMRLSAWITAQAPKLR